MKIKTKIRFIIYILGIIIGFILIGIAILMNNNDNKCENILNLNSNEIYNSNISEGLLSEISCTKEQAWENSYLEINNEKMIAKEYSINIHNYSSKDISYYSLKFTASEKIYLLTIWCGKKIEVHQFRNGNEIIEEIDFDNKKDSYLVETYNDGNNDLVVLEKGDYFIYEPSYLGWEIPISAFGNAYPGFICYQSIDIDYITPIIEFNYPIFNPSNNDINIYLESRNDIYGKIVENTDKPDYIMDTFNIFINNDTNMNIYSYSFKITFNEKMYFSNMWNNSIEVHQNVKGNEKIQVIDNPREIKNLANSNKLELDYIRNNSDVYIALNEGDYIIYNPNKDLENVKCYSNVDNGIILIYPNNEATPNLNIALSYYISYSIICYPLFWIGIFLIFIIIVLVIINFTIRYKTRNFITQKKYDEKIIVEAIETFTSFIDAKDPYTKGHSKRVSEYSKLIAQKMNMPADECQNVYYIALMHDCGKIGIPDYILTKPGMLTKEEYEIIKRHTTIGYDILKNFTSIEGIREGVLYHHERYDGKGYPNGIKGEEIPLIARIICVADSFDAMTSNRCYKKQLSKEDVINELINNKGTQFDPKIVDIFLKLIEENKIKF